MRSDFTLPEEWRPIVEYEGIYEASSRGGIRRVAASRTRRKWSVLTGTAEKNGYRRVRLSKNGHKQRWLVHQLVLTAFAGTPPKGHECNHCDRNKANNVLGNLEWVTKSENAIHALTSGLGFGKAVLTTEDIPTIRREARPGWGGNIAELAQRYGVHPSTISNVLQGKTWRYVP